MYRNTEAIDILKLGKRLSQDDIKKLIVVMIKSGRFKRYNRSDGGKGLMHVLPVYGAKKASEILERYKSRFLLFVL